MADSCSLPINDNKIDTEYSSTDEKVNNNKNNKRKMTLEQYHQLIDKLVKMEQIKSEERLVYEELNRLNAEKEHLQNLLNILHIMDMNDRMKNSRSRQRRLQKFNSNVRLN